MTFLPPFELFAEIYRRHGHRCPMSTLGGRLGHAARGRLDDDRSLTAAYHIPTCAADGIAVTTGCSRADGSLRVVDCGRHALWLQTADGRGIFAELKPETLQRSAGYRALGQALEQDRERLSPQEVADRLAEQEAFLDQLLDELRTLPDEELIDFSTGYPTDLRAAAER